MMDHDTSSNRRGRKVIGREENLADLKQALEPDDKSFKLVLVEAAGGLGKTYLLEEALRRAGHPDFRLSKIGRNSPHTLVTSTLIDVIDIRLHDSYRFVDRIRQSFRAYDPPVIFPTYDGKNRVGRETAAGAFLESMNKAKQEAIAAFESDLKQIAKEPQEAITDDGKNRVGRETAAGAFLESMNKAKQEAIAGFESDLKQITKGPQEAITDKPRVAIVVDTVERLESLTLENLFGPNVEKGIREELATLLDPEEDLGERTYQWLLNWIDKCRADKDANVTLVLAGRPDAPLFKELKERKEEEERKELDGQKKLKEWEKLNPLEVTLVPLDAEGVREYFEQVAKDDRRRAKKHKKGTPAEGPHPVAADPDKYQVLQLYTEGYPIRLALYNELVREGNQIPPQLQISYEQARKEAGLGPESGNGEVAADNSKLDVIRWKVEESFIDVLFQGVGRKARVMLALLRSPRGLTAAQLHFLLDSKDDQSVATWRPDKKKLRELAKILKEIERSPLGKRRSAWQDLAEIWPHDYDTHRVGLQDEIYTIFCNHTGLWSDFPDIPNETNEKLKKIRQHLKHEQKEYEQLFRDEKEARRRQYKKLASWAEYWCNCFRAQKRNYLAEDEARLDERLRLDNPHTFRFPFQSEENTRKRAAINAGITIFEIENLVYRLLLNAEVEIGLNNMALEDNRDLASRREDDFWAQSEVRQTLNDMDLMRFVDLNPDHVTAQQRTKKRQDTRYAVIQRVARQQEAARWIKRFVFTGQYGRAITFSTALDDLAWKLKQDDAEGRNLFQSWNHTLARGERAIWREYAHILQGDSGKDTLEKIEKTITALTKLYEKPYNKVVNRRSDAYPYAEHGFAKEPKDNTGPHPGWPRLGWILSHAHNNLGYGYRQRGQYVKAVEHHGRALDIIRPSPYKDMAKDHLARVLNNLARALMEMGNQSEVVALDGLNLRRELAEEVTLAASLNTLARIYDRAGRHEDAAKLSAKAIALCERAGESHQLGLSLLQMASALRHRAYTVRQGRQSVVDPDIYVTAAEELLFRAAELFSARDPNGQPRDKDHKVDLVQVQLERGRLLRDRLRHEIPAAEAGGSRAQKRRLRNRTKEIYLEAREILRWVEKQIEDESLDLPQISLNVKTNLARVDYYYYLLLSRIGQKKRKAEDLQRLRMSVEITLDDMRQDHKYDAHRDYQRDRDYPDQKVYKGLLDQAWIFRQLSTAEKLSGRLRLNQYLSLPPKEKESLQAEEYLRQAFTHYATASRYAELFAPQGRSVIALQDDLYEHLKRSNQLELKFQHDQLQALIRENEEDVGQVAFLQRIDSFLHNFFGLPAHT